jgi:carbamoyltransferase
MDFIHNILNSQPRELLFQAKADVAYGVQKILEYYFILFANELYNQTHSKNLCLAGGMAYNSSSNGRLLYETKFENIHVFPAAGDAGTAVGAALYGYYCIGGHKYYGNEKLRHAYLGKSYTDKDVVRAADKFQEELTWEKKDKAEFIRLAALDLKEGKIIGWFQGGAEFGPRALGHRSILANPAIKDMKDILNQRVKFRENFRPFAPSVLKEYVYDYFEYTQEESNFMLFICKVRDEKASVIPAVTHIDQSARIQTVTQENNGIFYDLINEFNEQTGIPLLLNTSYNLKDEPIVETPDDAITSFKKSNIDVLYINDYIIRKKKEAAK